MAASPGTLAEASRAADAASQLAQLYSRAPGAVQVLIDDALDSIEGSSQVAFASLGPERRLGVLRQGLLDDTVDTKYGRSRAQRITDAVALAAAPFDPTGFRWDPASADVWVRALTNSGKVGSSRPSPVKESRLLGRRPPPAGTL